MKSIFSNLFKSPLSNVFEGMTDWHCHILPGVDDGFKTMESSLAALERYEKAGIKAVYLTPHIMEDMPNTTDDLKAVFEELKKAYTGPIVLNLASENMIDFLFEQRLEAKDFLPLPGRRLLVETSYYNPPANLYTILRKIKSAGYFPVLAHPERYMYMSEQEYHATHDMGVFFQLNLPSLTGFYGPVVKLRAEGLLMDGLYDYVGTDLHNIRNFERMKETSISRKILEKLSF